jgi:hypothetical protein
VEGGRVTKRKAGKSALVAKHAQKEKAKKKPETRDCSICASTKTVHLSFTETEKGTCSHFRDICNRCVRMMVKTQIAEHKLNDAALACPFPDCASVLDHEALKVILPAAEFEL